VNNPKTSIGDEFKGTLVKNMLDDLYHGLVDNLLVALPDSAANFGRLIILPAYALIVTGAPAALARYVLGVSRPLY